MWQSVHLLAPLIMVVAVKGLTVTVSNSTCDGTYSVDKEEVRLIFTGGYLRRNCRFQITGTTGMYICSTPVSFYMTDCMTEVEYHEGFYKSSSPDETYSCSEEQSDDYCTSSSSLFVVFQSSSYGGDERSKRIDLKFYQEDDEIVKNIVDTVQTTVYVIIGVIVGVIVLVIIATVVVVICCCQRGSLRNQGNVYQAPLTAPYYVGGSYAYPMQGQTVFTAPQGYQPGYAPQQGYQPQQGNYPPTSQAGYEAPPDYQAQAMGNNVVENQKNKEDQTKEVF